MITKYRFQYKVAMGRFMLPVAIFVSFLIWGITFSNWLNTISLGICMAVAYLLIEMNTAFTLIRTRTALPSALFLLFYAACPFLQNYSAETWIPLLFLIVIGSLFKSYESADATNIFHAFLFLGISSLITPYILLFIPLLYFYMSYLRSFNIKTFFAGVVGIVTPYWLVSCYGLYTGRLTQIYTSFIKSVYFVPTDYSILSTQQYFSWGIVTIISIISSIQYYLHSYKDKVQTRIMLHILITTEIAVILLIGCQPQHFNALFPIQLIIGMIMNGHLFSLTFNKFTHFFLIFVLILWAVTCIINLWIHSFNF